MVRGKGPRTDQGRGTKQGPAEGGLGQQRAQEPGQALIPGSHMQAAGGGRLSPAQTVPENPLKGPGPDSEPEASLPIQSLTLGQQ